MRTLGQIERELKEAEAIASAESLDDSRDNEGRVVYTAAQRRERARNKVMMLRRELDTPFWREALARRDGA